MQLKAVQRLDGGATHFLPVYEPHPEAGRVYDNRGWSLLHRRRAERIIYVSSSEGDDRQAGGSPRTPIASIEKGYDQLRDAHADWLMLRAGDTFEQRDHLYWHKGGASPDRPMGMGVYGEGDRPVIVGPGLRNTHVDHPADPESGLRHLRFVGFAIEDRRRKPGLRRAGIDWMAKSEDVLFEDLRVLGFKDNLVLQGGASQPVRHVRIRRCIIADAWSTHTHSQGLFAKGVDGLLIEQCVFDHNGWHEAMPGAERTIYNHNLYIQRDNHNVVVRENISTRASSHGLQLRPGGLCENNLFARNALAMFNRGDTVRNVIVASDDIGEKPRGGGLTVMSPVADSRVRGNLIVNRLSADPEPGLKVVAQDDFGPRAADPHARTRVSHNTVYNWHDKQGRGLTVQPDAAPYAQLGDNLIDPTAAWVDTDRGFDDYMHRDEGGFDRFVARARQRPRRTWPAKCTAEAFNDYMRAGFRVTDATDNEAIEK